VHVRVRERGPYDDGKRFVVRADEKLTAFLELESAIRFSKRQSDNGSA
jgi:hypothetical protein